MQTRQAKSHGPNTAATKTAETPQKAAVSAASASRVPAWAGSMNDQIPTGLVLQDACNIPGLQAKLAISQPNDPYEQEADSAAEQVMRMPAIHASVPRSKLQLMRKERGDSQSTQGVLPAVHEALSSGGQPLNADVQASMESRFGTDFSQVRVHTDGQAAESAQAVSALAYTVGDDVVFGKGQYQPETSEGQKLLAHELTHVVQQRQALSPVPQHKALSTHTVSRPSDPLEQEADSAAKQATTDQPVSSNTISSITLGEHNVIARQPVDVSPPTQADEAVDTEQVESTAQGILRQLRLDPEDRSGQIKRQLIMMNPAMRATVIARVRSSTPPELQGPFSSVVDEANASINEVSTQPTRMEETTATSTSTAEAQKSSMSSTEMTTSVSETTSPNQSEAENIDRARSMVSPARTTPPQMATADMAALPSSSTSSTTAAPPVLIRAQGRETMVSTPNLAERGPRLSTVSSQLPTSTMAGGLLTESDQGTVGVSRGVEPKAVIGAGQTPSGRGSRQRYSAEQAEAEIQGIVATLSATAGESQERIQNQAETVKANITANAEALRQSIQAQVAEEEATIHSIFAEHLTSFLEMVEEARRGVAEKLETHRGEVTKSGEDAKNKVSDTFTEHRTSVEKAVSDKVAAAEQLQTHYTTYVHERTQVQSAEARRKGRDKAAAYPKDERGQVQANAAQGVADRTATEIEQREPETVKAVEDITVDIPEQFRQKGQEALDDFDKGLPDLLKNIDQEVQSALDALNQQANQAYQQLDTLKTQVLDQLATLEEGAVAGIQAIQPQADAQITNGVETAMKNINSATEDAIEQINQMVDETTQTLLNSGTSDVETSHRTADEVLNFLNGATSDVLAGLQQSESSTADELAQVESSAAEGLQNIEQDVTAQIQTLDQSSNTTLSQFADTVDENLSTTVQSLDESLTDLETQVSQQLEEPVQKLVQGFDDTLQQAEAKIVEAVDAGLAKNDEALGQLDPEMQKAADDAAWDYDHPILSTLRDIGEVVLGVIVGILAVLLVVVIAIVAFKLLIVGLVALGVSLVVAEIIAAVIGIGLLAYSIYQAYQARVAQGAKGGWGTFGMALLDIAGITDIVDAFTKKGISPFRRGYLFGKGAASLVVTIIGIRSAWKGIRGRFGGGAKGLPELPPGPEPPKALPPGPEPPKALPPGPEPPKALPPGPEPPKALPAGPESPKALPSGPEPPKALPAGPEPPKALPPKSEAFPTPEPEAPKVESRPAQPEKEPVPSELPASEGEKPTDQEPTEGTESKQGPSTPSGPNPGKGPVNNSKPGWGKGQIPCFPIGTLVSTPDGPCTIESLRVGDKVWAYDFHSKSVIIRNILALYRGSTNYWVDVYLDPGTLRATRRHPIWIESEQDWVAAAELAPGMKVRLQDGRMPEVIRVELLPQKERQETYNLCIEEVNNFFASGLRVLVHNTDINEPGHSNYVLRDANGRLYYSGRFGPGDTAAHVAYRHSNNHNRFNAANGDTIEVVPGTRTYGEARRLEHELCVENETYIGRDSNTWRGNRDYPMDSAKFEEYYRPDAC